MSAAPSPVLPWQFPAGDPPSGLTYPEVLRRPHQPPVRPLVGVLIAISLFFLVVPLVSQLVLLIGWLLRGRPDQRAYVSEALAYHHPEGLAATHLALGSLILVAFALVRYLHLQRPRWLCSVQPGMRWRYVLICLGVALVVLNAVLWASRIGAGVSFDAGQPGWPIFLAVLLVTSPLQAAAEEFFFRGYLLQALGSVFAADWGKWMGVVTSALIFAFFHGTQNLPLFIDRFGFGLLAGTLVVLTGGLEAGIAAHVINNLFAFGYAMFSGGVAQAKAVQAIGWGEAAADLIGFTLFGLVAWWVSRRLNLATTTP